MQRNADVRESFWVRVGGFAVGRWGWVPALFLVLLGGSILGVMSEGKSAGQSPVTIPATAESMRAAAMRTDFPGGDRLPVVLVIVRADGGVLSSADGEAVDQARERALAAARSGPVPIPVVRSEDGKAALAVVPVSAGLSGFELSDAVKAVRDAVTDGLPTTLSASVTGGPAFGADIANAFAGANITLLIVTGAVVALLLVITYRSPVLWLVPLLVIALADRVAAVLGTEIARLSGMAADGSTAGITSVLVFGAGTNYALLLISRYREELHRTPHHRAALRTAVSCAGPAILASNATVVLALLTLLLALSPSTRSLGVQAASGLVVALLFVLIVLPPLLAVLGPKLFWPFIPKPDGTRAVDSGGWRRVAAWVSDHARPVVVVTVVALAALSAALSAVPLGLSQIDQFRIRSDSVIGYERLAEHFPAGVTDPTRVLVHSESAEAALQAIRSTPGVVSATPGAQSPSGWTQLQVVTDAEPASRAAYDSVVALRNSVHKVDPGSLVGGSDAQAFDARNTAIRDRWVVMPAIIVVVLAVLYLLLRAAFAPLVLVAATLLSALAAIGLGGWASVHLLGFPGLDDTTPIFAFLFLVALGVDYTIFLVTRAKEETPDFGTREGMVRAVSATGAVITSGGIVLAAVFCVLGVLPLIVLTQLGVIVGLGILLDTFVVRTVLIPAVFAMIGPRIWWPSSLAQSRA
jgi:RND superfamily putative drug exporter